MPQSKEVHKEYMRKRRTDREVHKEGSQVEQGSQVLEIKTVNPRVFQENNITQYHPILEALVDPVKRQKLEAIHQALSRRKLTPKVYYGAGRYSIPFDIVGDLLDATA